MASTSISSNVLAPVGRACGAGRPRGRAICSAVRGPAVGLDVADDDVGAALLAPPALVEHGEGLADARRGAEVDAQRRPGAIVSRQLRSPELVEGEVQLEDVHARLAEEAEAAPVGVVVDQLEHLVDVEVRAPRRPAAAWMRALATEMCGSRPLRRRR